MSFMDLVEWIVIVGGVTALGLYGMIQWLKYLQEEEEKVNEAVNSSMINDMWVCKECGAFNSPYNKRCGKCFNIKADKNEK